MKKLTISNLFNALGWRARRGGRTWKGCRILSLPTQGTVEPCALWFLFPRGRRWIARILNLHPITFLTRHICIRKFRTFINVAKTAFQQIEHKPHCGFHEDLSLEKLTKLAIAKCMQRKNYANSNHCLKIQQIFWK